MKKTLTLMLLQVVMLVGSIGSWAQSDGGEDAVKQFLSGLKEAATEAGVTPGQRSSRLSVGEAFDKISQVGTLQKQTRLDSIPFINGEYLDSVRIACAARLDATLTRQTGDAIYDVLNRVDLSLMINGASNHLVEAFVYAQPLSDGRYEVLIVAGSGATGAFAAIYGTTGQQLVETLGAAPLTMHGPNLTIALGNSGQSTDYLVQIAE